MKILFLSQEMKVEFLPLMFTPKLANSPFHAKRNLLDVVKNIVVSCESKLNFSFMDHFTF